VLVKIPDTTDMIVLHVLSESSIDTTLSGNSVTSCRKQLAYTSSIEASFRQTERRS